MIKSKYINYFECGADILAKLLITLLLQIRFACKVTAQPEIFEFKWLNVCVFLISSQAFFFFFRLCVLTSGYDLCNKSSLVSVNKVNMSRLILTLKLIWMPNHNHEKCQPCFSCCKWNCYSAGLMSLSECICYCDIKETGLKQKNNSVLSYIYLNFYSTARPIKVAREKYYAGVSCATTSSLLAAFGYFCWQQRLVVCSNAHVEPNMIVLK